MGKNGEHERFCHSETIRFGDHDKKVEDIFVFFLVPETENRKTRGVQLTQPNQNDKLDFVATTLRVPRFLCWKDAVLGRLIIQS